MNRRQFLSSTAAGILAAPALLRGASAQEGPFRVKYFPVDAGVGLHDVAPAPDGTIWFTGQRNGTLGRLDPRDGSFKLVGLGKGAAPHGVTIGPDGAAWVTEGGQNAIARVDPGDHKVTLFHLPEKYAYANLNTGVFDKTRHLLVHRPVRHLRPARSQVRRHHAYSRPRAASAPTASRSRRRARSGTPRSPATTSQRSILRRDRRRVVEPPTPKQGARRIWSDSRSRLWVSEWNSGNVSLHDPADGSWKAWKLPGNSPRAYAVYVDDKDKVWLTDFSAQRDRALRSRKREIQRLRQRQAGRQCTAAGRHVRVRSGAPNPAPTASWRFKRSRRRSILRPVVQHPRHVNG